MATARCLGFLSEIYTGVVLMFGTKWVSNDAMQKQEIKFCAIFVVPNATRDKLPEIIVGIFCQRETFQESSDLVDVPKDRKCQPALLTAYIAGAHNPLRSSCCFTILHENFNGRVFWKYYEVVFFANGHILNDKLAGDGLQLFSFTKDVTGKDGTVHMTYKHCQ